MQNKSVIRSFAFVAALMFGWQPAFAQEQERFAMIVGNNVGNKPERSLQFAESEVARLADILKGWGSFTRIDLLQGDDAGAMRAALTRLRDSLVAARAQGKSTMFLFYYSGHGDNEALEMGGTRFALRDLRAYLEELPADVRMAFVDACQSGALTGVKGGRRAPAYKVQVADPGSVSGMAIITSSTANELSQESDELRGSFFSHNIMSGLRGAADASRDGQVTLSELYQYTFARTLANTAASLIGGQHPTYETRMAGTGEVILTRTRSSDAQITFPKERNVSYSVFSGGNVAAEVLSDEVHDLYLALPAGSYRVVRRALGGLREKRYDLAAGSSTALQADSMDLVAMDTGRQRKKGGGIAGTRVLGVQGGIESGAVGGTSVAHGNAGLSFLYATEWASLRFRADFSRFDGVATDGNGNAVTENSQFLRIVPSLDVLLPIWDGSTFAFLGGASVGAPFMRQTGSSDVLPNGASTELGYAMGAVGSGLYRAGGGLEVWLNVFAGGESFKEEKLRVYRTAISTTLGAGFAF
jgi:Caspase domain